MGLKINNMPMVPAKALERAQGELKTAYAEIAELHMELESLGDGLDEDQGGHGGAAPTHMPPVASQSLVPASAPASPAAEAIRADELKEVAALTRVAKAARNVLGMVDDKAERADVDAALQVLRMRLAALDALNPERGG